MWEHDRADTIHYFQLMYSAKLYMMAVSQKHLYHHVSTVSTVGCIATGGAWFNFPIGMTTARSGGKHCKMCTKHFLCLTFVIGSNRFYFQGNVSMSDEGQGSWSINIFFCFKKKYNA